MPAQRCEAGSANCVVAGTNGIEHSNADSSAQIRVDISRWYYWCWPSWAASFGTAMDRGTPAAAQIQHTAPVGFSFGAVCVHAALRCGGGRGIAGAMVLPRACCWQRRRLPDLRATS